MKTFLRNSLTALIATAITASTANAAPRSAANEGPAYSVVQSTSFSAVVSPPIPKKITFAGTTYDFDQIDRYERLDREVTQMCYSHASTLLMLKRANRYFPIIAPILHQNGIPADIIYLACIESTLNPLAFSSAKAAGMWQFMSATATQYGLEVTDYVDERYNIEKATDAAARYLKAAYAKYGNWESAMASYNGGPGRISTELDSQMATTSLNLYLNDETTRYVYRIFAAKVIMENPVKYGYNILADQFYTPLSYTEETVTASIDNLPQWAIDHGITYAQLREYNPWIRAKKLPVANGQSYVIKIPQKESLSKSANKLSKKHLYNPHWVR